MIGIVLSYLFGCFLAVVKVGCAKIVPILKAFFNARVHIHVFKVPIVDIL